MIRISETYGPGDRRLLKLFRAIRSGRFMVIGPGLNLHQPIFVEDLVTALRRAAELDAASGETIVAAGAESLTTRDMVDAIASALNRKVAGVHLPLWPLMAAARVLETVAT